MHILAVDDNITTRQLISMTIKKTLDIRVSLAQSGQEALDMARTTPFDMFLIDWSMHPMDGESY
jgi:two-component system sensor histidine kinase BarA